MKHITVLLTAAFILLCSATYAKENNLFFIENKGQITDQHYNPRNDIQFKLAASGGLNIFIGSGAIHYQFSKFDDAGAETQNAGNLPHTSLPLGEGWGGALYRLDVELLNANKNAQVITEDKQPYYENYYTPGTGAHGATAHTYKRITYKNIYPQIDWVLYTSSPLNSHSFSEGMSGEGRGGAKHEFIIHKGGNVSDIKIQYSGATTLQLNSDGSLIAATPMGEIAEQAPLTYQVNGKEIRSTFVLEGNTLSYSVGSYSGELVIDPTLMWATYYGGSATDMGNSVALDAAGHAYMVGTTYSIDNIATTGAHSDTFVGTFDAFLVKLDSFGARLWATYYGDTLGDGGFSVAADASGHVYMAGQTRSTAGISTPGAHQEVFGGGTFYDAFLVQFDGAGIRQWATYYGGGSGTELLASNALALDALGNIYMAGITTSSSGIATAGSHQEVFGTGYSAFLVKFNNAGVRQWATYYSGSHESYGLAATTDTFGNIYLSGHTGSLSGIATPGAWQPVKSTGPSDAFLVKFNSGGVRQWGTYYGGDALDVAKAVSTDKWGNVYIGGATESRTLASAGAFQDTFVVNLSAPGPAFEGILVKFNSAGVRQWATYYGGINNDGISSVVTDAAGNVYIAGYTNSAGRATADGYDTSLSGPYSFFTPYDGFVAKFSSAGARLWGTYYGGDAADEISSMAVDKVGNLYITGYTSSLSSIATAGSFQPACGGGGSDAFLVRFGKMWPVAAQAATSQSGDVLLYPNPNSGSFTLSANEAGTLGIYAIDGRELAVYNVGNGTITIALPHHISPGIYLCRHQTENGAVTITRLVYAP
jgi:hypothetical protein